jgi:hypothetical protein
LLLLLLLLLGVWRRSNGSALVKEVREKKDKDKSRLRFWEMAGSKMASVTGLTGEEAAAAAAKEAQEVGARCCITTCSCP